MTDKAKERQELLNKIAVAVTDRIAQAKSDGNNPYTEDTVRNLISEEMQRREDLNKAKNEETLDQRAKRLTEGFDGLEDGADKGFEANNKVGFDHLKTNQSISPFSYRGKMRMTERELKQFCSPAEIGRIKEAQQMNNALYIMGMYFAKRYDMPYAEAVQRTKTFNQYRERVRQDKDFAKAINTTTTAQGLELVPVELAGNIRERQELDLIVSNRFEEIPMPTNPYKMPVDTGDADAFIVNQTTVDNPTDADKVDASTPPTGDFTFNAKGIGTRVMISYEATEDTILDNLGYMTKKMSKGLGIGQEQAVINGDLTATHQDSDTHAGSAKLPAKAWYGLRYYGRNNAGGTVDFANGDPTKQLLGQIMLKVGKYASMVNDLFWLVGSNSYTKMRIAEIGVFTVDQFGPGAVVHTGQLPHWAGIDIITGRTVRENLNVNGVYDGTTTDRSNILLVNQEGFLMGNRRQILLETDRDIQAQQVILVASMRKHFKSPWDPTNALYPFVGMGRNVRTI